MIEAIGLTKNYGSTEAVRGVSFSAGPGQIVGLLGPNGAGKTTLLRMLSAFHFPDEGDALIGGISVTADPVAAKRLIGYLPENAPSYGDSTVSEQLGFIADVRLLRAARRRERLEKVVADFGLGAVLHKRIDELSKGFRQRVGFAQAVLHDPPILILDEPANGLDPNQVLEIRALILELGKSKTVLLSTHILQEAEAVCSRLIIMSKGRVAAQGETGVVSAGAASDGRSAGNTWSIELSGGDIDLIAAAAAEIPGRISSTRPSLSEDGRSVHLEITLDPHGPDDDGGGKSVFDWAVRSGLKIVGMSRQRATLEEAFVRITGDGSPS